MSAVRYPVNYIMHDGQRFVEVEWPADGRYEISRQLAKETERPGIGRYMGLFEFASRKKIKAPADDSAGEKKP